VRVSNGELRRRAAELGVSVSYWDWQGHEVVVSDQTLAAIVAALEADAGNQTRAARRLGLSRRALIYKMEKYGLKAPPARGES